VIAVLIGEVKQIYRCEAVKLKMDAVAESTFGWTLSSKFVAVLWQCR
jgi:hypothetical protein